MARPYIFEDNFESGGVGAWDSETDVELALNVRHYSWLAREDATKVGPIAPYRGAYVLEFDSKGDTADHVLIEGDMDIADTATGYAGFYLFLGKDLRGVTDIFNIFELQGTVNAVEAAISLRITTGSDEVEIGVGQTAAATFSTEKLQKGRWYHIGLKTLVSTGGVGTSELFVDGVSRHSIGTITNTAVLRGVLGIQDTLSTTLGHIYFDQFAFDDGQILPFSDRYPETILIYKSQHIALGQTDLLNVTLEQGAGTDNVLKIYDTDKANTTDEHNLVAWLYNLTASEPPIDLADVPVTVKRGAYVQLTGTSPRALIHIGSSQGYYSAGRVRQHGAKR